MTNRFGVDVYYFEENLRVLKRDIDNYTPQELARALTRLAMVADEQVTRETADFRVGGGDDI